MLASRVTNVGINDQGAYIEYLEDGLDGTEDQVAYLGEAGRAQSRWLGSGAALLGLEGPVDADVIRAYSECRDPVTGEQLGSQLPKKWGAFEFEFTVGKDISALWAISAPEQRRVIEEAGWIAAAVGIEEAERQGASWGRGSIRGSPVTHRSRGLITAGWMHGTARPADADLAGGDPHLHYHAFIANRVLCADGQWRSVHSDPLVRASRTAISSVAAVALRQVLTADLEYGWERGSGGRWRVAGVPADLTEMWSKRHAQIVADAQAATAAYINRLTAEAAQRGEAPPELTLGERTELVKTFARRLVDKRRERKNLDEPEGDRFDRWTAEAAALVDIEQVLDAVAEAGAAYRETLQAWTYPPEQRPVAFAGAGAGTPAAAVEALTEALESRATWLSRDIVHAAAQLVPPGADVRWVQALVDEALAPNTDITAEITDPHLISTDHRDFWRGDPTERRWQSRRVWDAERAIADAYQSGLGSGAATAAGRRDWDHGLSDAQASEIERVCSSGDRISCIVGPAGAGKTTLMAAAARRFEAAGHTVSGLAVSAAAVNELASAGVGQCHTIASVLAHDPDTAEGRRAIQKMGRVWIWDEASMGATLDMAEILHRAQRAGAKVILVGDPNQLGAVGAGGMFAHLVDDLGAAEALEEVHRFRNSWEGPNSLRLRAGDTDALEVLDDLGRISSAADIAAAQTIARSFTAETVAAGAVPLMVARTRAQVHQLNQAARDALDLGDVVYERRRDDLDVDQAFAVGDIIVTGRNTGRHRWALARRSKRITDTAGDAIRNGDRWRVTGGSVDALGEAVLTVQRITDDDSPAATAALPGSYIAGSDADGRPWIEHGVATTVHRSQGRTVDYAMAFCDERTTRNGLYVGLTRARFSNRLVMIGAREPDEALEAAKAALRRRERQTAGLAHSHQTRVDAHARRSRLSAGVGDASPPDDVLAASAPDVDTPDPDKPATAWPRIDWAAVEHFRRQKAALDAREARRVAESAPVPDRDDAAPPEVIDASAPATEIDWDAVAHDRARKAALDAQDAARARKAALDADEAAHKAAQDAQAAQRAAEEAARAAQAARKATQAAQTAAMEALDADETASKALDDRKTLRERLRSDHNAALLARIERRNDYGKAVEAHREAQQARRQARQAAHRTAETLETARQQPEPRRAAAREQHRGELDALEAAHRAALEDLRTRERVERAAAVRVGVAAERLRTAEGRVAVTQAALDAVLPDPDPPDLEGPILGP